MLRTLSEVLTKRSVFFLQGPVRLVYVRGTVFATVCGKRAGGETFDRLGAAYGRRCVLLEVCIQ